MVSKWTIQTTEASSDSASVATVVSNQVSLILRCHNLSQSKAVCKRSTTCCACCKALMQGTSDLSHLVGHAALNLLRT